MIVVWWLLVVGGGCGCFGCLWAAGGCVVVGFCVVVGGLSVVCALWLVIGGGFVVAVCGAWLPGCLGVVCGLLCAGWLCPGRGGLAVFCWIVFVVVAIGGGSWQFLFGFLWLLCGFCVAVPFGGVASWG